MYVIMLMMKLNLFNVPIMRKMVIIISMDIMILS